MLKPKPKHLLKPKIRLKTKSTDLVFADGGDDTIITDGENSTYVFGGQGYDTLISQLDSYNDLPPRS